MNARLKFDRLGRRRPLPWNHISARPNPLSVSLSKMAAYRIIHRSPNKIRLLCRLLLSLPQQQLPKIGLRLVLVLFYLLS